MSNSHFALYSRESGETPETFGKRIRDLASGLATRPDALAVVAYVDDGDTGAPREADFGAEGYDAAILTTGIPADALPPATAVFGIQRRVIKARRRGTDGARSAGFTRVFLVHRAPHLDHDQFNDHWRESHSRVHVENSPGTRHYEQLFFEEYLTPDAPKWDGVTLLSFANMDDFTTRLFGPGGKEAIAADSKKFVNPPTETFATSEFVYVDDRPKAMYLDDES